MRKLALALLASCALVQAARAGQVPDPANVTSPLTGGHGVVATGGQSIGDSGGAPGTVTSVAVSPGSSVLTVSGSPLTVSGTITLGLATQSANCVLAGPASGSAAVPTCRPLVAADIPGALTITGGTINGSTIGGTTPAPGSFTTVNATGLYQNGSPLGNYALISAGPLTNSLTSTVTFALQSTFYDGPSVAQGAAGTWFASGTVTLTDTAGAATFVCKLWDGATTIASGSFQATTTMRGSLALSGVLASPAGNLRISCADVSNAATGEMLQTGSGGGNTASTITAFRIN